MLNKYRVTVNLTGNKPTVEIFRSKKDALAACFLALSILDYEERYNNISCLEKFMKYKDYTKAGISDSLKTWNVDIERYR